MTALLDELHRVLDELLTRVLRAHVDMQVDIRSFATLAADELVDRHAGLPTLDVPERVTDAADGAIEHRVILVVGAHVAELPDLLDPIGRPADDQGLEIVGDGGGDEFGAAAREGGRGAPVTIEPRLVGGDLHHG